MLHSVAVIPTHQGNQIQKIPLSSSGINQYNMRYQCSLQMHFVRPYFDEGPLYQIPVSPLMFWQFLHLASYT